MHNDFCAVDVQFEVVTVESPVIVLGDSFSSFVVSQILPFGEFELRDDSLSRGHEFIKVVSLTVSATSVVKTDVIFMFDCAMVGCADGTSTSTGFALDCEEVIATCSVGGEIEDSPSETDGDDEFSLLPSELSLSLIHI